MLEPRKYGSFQHKFVPPDQRAPVAMWVHWLTRLRWLAIAALACVVGFFVTVLDSPGFTLPVMAAVLGLLTAANLSTSQRLAEGDGFADHELLAQLALDVFSLTIVLMLSGGTSNPFAMLLLLHVAMGVMVLSKMEAASLLALIVGCFGLLSFAWLPLHLDAHPLGAHLLSLWGPPVAFAITSVTLGGFLRGMVRSLRLSDERSRLPEDEDEDEVHVVTGDGRVEI